MIDDLTVSDILCAFGKAVSSLLSSSYAKYKLIMK